MALTPFYKVSIKKTGRDLSPEISRFTYELAVDADNLLVIEIRTNTTDIIDDPDMKEGEILTFNFGYLEGKQSAMYLGRISDIICNYGAPITITIRCSDLGQLMKKNSSKKVWTNVRSSDIVRKIALANGLTAVVEDTKIVHRSMPQAMRSDYDFIKFLSGLEKDGSWRFFLRSDELHFTRLKLESPSVKTITFADPNGKVKTFRPYSQETLKSAAARDTIISTMDPFTGEVKQSVVNNSTAKDDVKLGEYTYDVNSTQINFKPKITIGGTSSTGIQIGGKKTEPFNGLRPSQVQKAQNDPSKTGQHVYSPTRSLEEALNIANKVKKKKALSDYMANLSLEGDPDFVEDIVITMSGVSKKDTGNWYVSRVTHSIDPGNSYETRVTLNKNAGKKVVSDTTKQSPAATNNTIGPDNKEGTVEKAEVKIFYYNKDGNEIPKP